MPFLNPKAWEETVALANAPTLGNLHPDARKQAIARAAVADREAMQRRMEFLHGSASVDADGYEWGVFRVKWENGRAVDVQRVRADHSDLDAAIARSIDARGVLGQVASGMQALDAGHDALCMKVIRGDGAACTCGVKGGSDAR